MVVLKYQFERHDVDELLPLIYCWEIRDHGGNLVGRYVGKSKNGARRPLEDYANNVRKLLAGLPYRRSKPDRFRRIHRALARAHQEGSIIALQLICNVPPGENINAVERRWIMAMNCAGNEPWQLND